MNVFDAAIDRLEKVFNDFDNVVVSFSGGKDSGVMLNLTSIVAKKLGRSFSIMHMDYEAQYQMTTDYVDKTLFSHNGNVYRICVPFKVTTCTSMHEDYWRPWEDDKKEIWVRPFPKDGMGVESFDYYAPNMWDYEFQNKFARWQHKKVSSLKTAYLIGIRTQESFHRWKAIFAERTKDTNYKGWQWSTKMFANIYNFYPIYDWKVEDVWIANAKYNWDYNKLYDVFQQAGVPLGKQRVASPFISAAQESLKLYKVVEPNVWGKLIGRVNGVNFTGLYGGTTAMGWRDIKLPPGHNWKSYMEFLLTTLPKPVSDNYKKKLLTSVKYWKNKGGEVSLETITELESEGVLFTTGELNIVTGRKKIQLEYLDDTTVKEFRLIPTYKRMCICIMKNDHVCKYAGYGLTKNEWALRKGAEEKYKNI